MNLHTLSESGIVKAFLGERFCTIYQIFKFVNFCLELHFWKKILTILYKETCTNILLKCLFKMKKMKLKCPLNDDYGLGNNI